MTVVRTPIHVDVWKELTAGHPDREYVVECISKGLQEGFRIGFNSDSLVASELRGELSSGR